MILKGKTAIITGASRGIGKAIAQRFLEEGAMVVALSKTPKALLETISEFQSKLNSYDILALPCDISDEETVKKTFDFIQKSTKKIDILVNAAGIAGTYAAVPQSNFSDWKKVFEVNVFGTYLAMKYVLPGMCEKHSGKIINFFGGSDGPLVGFSAYNASKAAIVRLTETAAKEVAPFRIDINVIAPGPVKTRLFDDMISQSKQNPPPNVDAEKAVELVLFLASEQSDGLRGKFLSAIWDNWQKIPENMSLIMNDPDVFTLRRRKGEL